MNDLPTHHRSPQDEVIRAAMAVENQAAMIRDEFAAGCRRAEAFRIKVQERRLNG